MAALPSPFRKTRQTRRRIVNYHEQEMSLASMDILDWLDLFVCYEVELPFTFSSGLV